MEINLLTALFFSLLDCLDFTALFFSSNLDSFWASHPCSWGLVSFFFSSIFPFHCLSCSSNLSCSLFMSVSGTNTVQCKFNSHSEFEQDRTTSQAQEELTKNKTSSANPYKSTTKTSQLEFSTKFFENQILKNTKTYLSYLLVIFFFSSSYFRFSIVSSISSSHHTPYTLLSPQVCWLSCLAESSIGPFITIDIELSSGLTMIYNLGETNFRVSIMSSISSSHYTPYTLLHDRCVQPIVSKNATNSQIKKHMDMSHKISAERKPCYQLKTHFLRVCPKCGSGLESATIKDKKILFFRNPSRNFILLETPSRAADDYSHASELSWLKTSMTTGADIGC
ncbi:putative signal peptide protein [Puccinia sorghi]|uniref:Putative signal peptide protein n=1 Tax=Puccinia sorghi TaxID=27349 RepID=A0A0L6UJJ0_9BASI|nr:putative signal peptide protein [Puccinia sorghi]